MSAAAYLSPAEVAARYGIDDATLDAWLIDDAVAFPRPMLIRGARRFSEEQLRAWEARQAGEEPPPEPESDFDLVELPVISPTITDYRQLVETLAIIRHARGLSLSELEHITGLQAGYASKLEHFDKPYGRNAGSTSLPRWLGGLKVGIVLVDLSAAA